MCPLNSSAVLRLLERHQSPLLRYARGILGDLGAAEDVVQETFLRCIQKAPDFGNDGVAQGWLFTVCRNLAYDNRKMNQREHARRDKLSSPETLDPPTLLSQKELVEDMRFALQELPMKEGEALRLKVHEGMKYEQIGEILGVSRGTVGWLVHRAMGRLSKRFRASQDF